MRIFVTELRNNHRGNVIRLFQRHRYWMAYILIVFGVANFFMIRSHDLVNIERKEAITRGIICQQTTRQDKQTLANLHTKIDRELMKSLHISNIELKTLIHKQLQASAEERRILQPSDPVSACSSKLTVLR